jgi:hypothetical protein
MVDLEIQAQVGSVSSKHLEDFSTSLRTGSKTQAACLQHPEPTPIFGTSHPDFKLQIRPTSCSHDIFHTQRNMTQCRCLRKVRQASTYIQPGLQLSSCHHAQHTSLSTRDAIAITIILRQNGATTNLLGIAAPGLTLLHVELLYKRWRQTPSTRHDGVYLQIGLGRKQRQQRKI